MSEAEAYRVRREGHARRARHEQEDADYAAQMQSIRDKAAEQAEQEEGGT